ncbi:MAG: hypothetical protein K9N06_04575 [Candidatus Cloacimonetes bacterium]|nr:hypothetical protein [Candidatus Cloacimonadota bacterium]
MKKILLIACLILSSSSLLAIFDDYEPSPRARAMGGAFYTISDDQLGVFYNPAGVALAGSGISVSYCKIFNNDFQVLNALGFSYELPRNFGSFALGLEAMDVDYLDVNLMSEKIYNISHAFILISDTDSELYLGYSGNFYSLSLDTFGSESALGLNLGALAIFKQRVRLGFTVNNLNNPAFGKDQSEYLAQKMTAGLAYEPFPVLLAALELEKKSGRSGAENGKTEIHGGIEFKAHDMLMLRTGVRNDPDSFSFGAGFKLSEFTLDYAYNTHAVLDGTHHFGLNYKFK